MTVVPVFWGNVESGKLTFVDKEKFLKHLHSLNGEVQIIVRKYYKQRTTDQNSYYWALLKILSMYTGDEPDDIHYFFRTKFLGNSDSKLGIPRSTTTLNTVEFIEYIDQIRRFCAENCPEVVLPDPDGFYQITDEYNN